MNALHSLLKMVVAQQADELRLGVERAPLVLTSGVPQNLTLAETGERVLRQMLGTLLSPQAEAALARGEAYSYMHDAGVGFGSYQVEFLPRPKHEAGFDVRLTSAQQQAAAVAAPVSALFVSGPVRPASASARAPDEFARSVARTRSSAARKRHSRAPRRSRIRTYRWQIVAARGRRARHSRAARRCLRGRDRA